ncbi:MULTISPECIES: hypothetical protein [unclassified Rathayibacter]|uniref:hypothetical protein n=1 Tax=unclassified Rathayibacter TaxID=2609250 RepID=UPI0006F26C2B|nr:MULTISPECIES: hypothetical protein [unclassified Rathayibacter]KQQ05813.1 hypothetical protein ASF42_04480 [Rathayibacter sp. Leaf294]KQS13671.1 hypothetical protein ASG06_04490 [Rathayibacter sp. Leaf185]
MDDTQPPARDASEPEVAPTPEQRALRAIRNVSEGCDPSIEAFMLSNEYTDRRLEQLRSIWTRWRSRR